MRRTPTRTKRAKRDSVADPTVSGPDLAEQREEATRAHADLEPGRSDLRTLECWSRSGEIESRAAWERGGGQG